MGSTNKKWLKYSITLLGHIKLWQTKQQMLQSLNWCCSRSISIQNRVHASVPKIQLQILNLSYARKNILFYKFAHPRWVVSYVFSLSSYHSRKAQWQHWCVFLQTETRLRLNCCFVAAFTYNYSSYKTRYKVIELPYKGRLEIYINLVLLLWLLWCLKPWTWSTICLRALLCQGI